MSCSRVHLRNDDGEAVKWFGPGHDRHSDQQMTNVSASKGIYKGNKLS